jgi:hypothetical protein
MYGKGIINDDTDNNNKYDYSYSGWEIKAVLVILPQWLELGFRYDTYTGENTILNGQETMIAYTFGLTFMFKEYVKIQANYKWKFLDSELNNDFDDNIFILQTQFKY